MCACSTDLEDLDGEKEAEEQLVRLEQAPADVHVHRLREAVVKVLQPPFQVGRRGGVADRLAEERAEPRQGVLVHRVDLPLSPNGMKMYACDVRAGHRMRRQHR